MFVNEQAGVRCRGFKSKVVHAFAEMLVKEFGAVKLTVKTLLQL